MVTIGIGVFADAVTAATRRGRSVDAGRVVDIPVQHGGERSCEAVKGDTGLHYAQEGRSYCPPG